MVTKENFDIIIIGSGVSGLILANEIIERTDKSVLLLEKKKKIQFDKNLCFWNLPNNLLTSEADNKWNKICVIIHGKKLILNNNDIKYQRLKSKTVFDFFIKKLSKRKNFHFLMGQNVKSINSHENRIFVNLEKKVFKSKLIFDSRLEIKEVKKKDLLQHFYGAEVVFEKKILNSDEIILMDILKHKNLFHFMYILPFSEKKMLIETTYFSTKVLSLREYKKDIKDYMYKNFGEIKYKIKFFESGVIPMFKINQSKIKNYIRIGVSGNWNKLSTGYSLQNSFTYARQIVDCILVGKYPSIKENYIYNFLDQTLCKFIKNNPKKTAFFFKRFFKNNNLKTIVKFLTNSANYLEIIKIIFSLPKIQLLRSIFYTR